MRLLTACVFAAIATPALAQGPQTAPADYEAARGAGFDDGVSAAWDILVASTDGAASLNRVQAELGEDWVAWREPGSPAQWVDIKEGRILRLSGDTLTNIALVAEARRRLDIYAGLSRAGSLDEIEFGGAGRFHRVWLEAAMGVAARSGDVEVRDTAFGFEAVFENTIVFSADYGAGDATLCGDMRIEDDRRDSALALIRHAVPIHPDAFNALKAREGTPCAFSYTVFSPDSPNGRFESWVLREGGAALPRPTEAGSETLPQAELLGETGDAALSAARSDGADAPDPMTFFTEVQTLRSLGDMAGAFLVTVQETHHFGPCPEQAVGSVRLSCAEAASLLQQAGEDPALRQVLEGLTALRQRNHAAAVEALAPFTLREGRAGAAARILVANELVAWGREGLDAYPALDPAGMLAEALTMDPYAPDTYWHLGRRYLEAGAPLAAWTLFDLGRALPDREITPLLAQVDTLEAQISALAPDWVSPSAPSLESGQ
jgi:hypothetical protein